MKHGFIKAAAITPDLKVADPVYNSQVICQKIEEAEKEGAVLLVFPELCISGYTCHDLFLQETLLVACKEQLQKIAGFIRGKNCIAFVGLPLEKDGKLYKLEGNSLQSQQAYRSGLSYQGKPMHFKLYDDWGYLIPEERLYVPRFRERCRTCGMRICCNGCSDCGGCEKGGL